MNTAILNSAITHEDPIMNILKATALSLTALAAAGLYSAPAMSAMVDATNAWFQYGNGQAGITTADDRHKDGNATDSSTSTFRSLGLNGMGVFGFAGQEFSGTVTIWETTFNPTTPNKDGTWSHWPEQVKVYGGTADVWNTTDKFSAFNLDQWTELGTLGNADAQNGGSISFNGTYKWLLLVDQGLKAPAPEDGFDVAKVSASTVPIPAAAWLFGSALLGLVGVARRRKSVQV